MPHSNIFQWRAGLGWLVLAGGLEAGVDTVSAIEANMLNRTVSQGPMAYIWAASDADSADRHMESLRDLGARTGYLIDILAEDDESLFRQISEAGIIVLGSGPNLETLQAAMVGVVLRGLEEAFANGATIYAPGDSAALLGAYAVHGSELVRGFDWLRQATILAGFTPEQADTLRSQIQDMPEYYGLGLGHGAALALGPAAEVEVWGNRAITVLLGQNYTPGADVSDDE